MKVDVWRVELVIYGAVEAGLCAVWWTAVTLEMTGAYPNMVGSDKAWGLEVWRGLSSVYFRVAYFSWVHSHCDPCDQNHGSANRKSSVMRLSPNVSNALEQIQLAF